MSYKRKKISIQTKIIWELHKQQPLSFTKLRKRIPENNVSTFYANLNLLVKFDIVRFVDEKVTMVKSTYALSDFKRGNFDEKK